MKLAINNVHKIRKSFQKILEMHTHFERPCNKLKNVTSKLKILKSRLEDLKKFKSLPILSEFQFYISLPILILSFQI